MRNYKRGLALLLAVLLLVPSFVFPAIGDVNDFTMTVKATGDNYNVGDTVSMEIYISASADSKTINSYQFTLNYDNTRLNLNEVRNLVEGGNDTEVISAENSSTNTYAYVIKGASGAVISGQMKAATVTFTVLENIGSCDQTTISLDKCYVGVKNDKADPSVGYGDAKATVNLHKHVITLNAGEGATINDGSSLTLYAKYGVAGLYSDVACKNPVNNITIKEKTGYALGTPQWSDGSADFAAVAAKVFTSSATLTLNTVKMSKVSVTGGSFTGGKVTGGEFYVMPNTGISHELLTEKGITVDADPGYSFAGWTVNGETLGTTGSVTVSGDVTVTPIFTANTYSFTLPAESEKYTVEDITGVTDNKVTHGQNVTFKVEPSSGYAISNVSWIDHNGTSNPLTAVNGVYTIPGDKILGDVSVKIETVNYCTITFKAGEGAVLSETVLYTKCGVGGLYSNPACTYKADVPVPTAAEGYRLPEDKGKEPMWSGKYTSAALGTEIFKENVTLTVTGIQQITVTFVAGANGSIEGEATRTVDKGTSFASAAPKANPAAGYKFDGWTPAVTNITEAQEFTANFSAATFKLSTTSFTTYSINVTTVEGITANGDGSYSVVYGTDVNFSVTGENGATVTGVEYQVGNGEKVKLSAVNGSYTIPGTAITDSVTIIVSVNNNGNITFDAGDHGSIDGAATKVLTFTNGYVLTAEDVPTPTADPGYEFTGWSKNPVGEKVVGDAKYVAQYKDGSYAVTIDGVAKDNATHGKDYTIPAYSDGKVISKVTVTVGGNVVNTTVDENGNYVIAGPDITGTIAVTTVSSEITVKFIYQTQYKAIKSGEKIAVLQTEKLGDSKYQLNDGVEFYWSAKYNAYVRFVDINMTASQLAAQLRRADGAATEIVYDGDISGNGSVNVVDAGIINDTLNGNVDSSEVTPMMLFKMDVYNADASDAETVLNGQNVQVTTADIYAILNVAVGKDVLR